MKLVLISFCLLFFLTGCMPFWVWDDAYYRPESSPGGRVTKSFCRGSVGPPDKYEILTHDVIISIKAVECEQGIIINIDLEIPPGKEVRFKNAPISIFTTSNIEPYKGLLERRDGREFFEPMTGGNKVLFRSFGTNHYKNNSFSFFKTIEMPKSETIKVRIPDITINTQMVEMPEITFSKKTYYLEFFMPINC